MPAKRKGSRKKGSPKRVLRLPDLDHSKRTVLDSLGSPDSARAYAFAMNDFIAWYCSEPRLAFSKHVVLRYRQTSPEMAAPMLHHRDPQSRAHDSHAFQRPMVATALSALPCGASQRMVGRQGSVSKVDMTTRIPLIYKILFPFISTFETLPSTKS